MRTREPLAAVDVVILAGGRGTRLGGDVPKCLREVAGRPFLEHLFDQLRSAGAARAILSLGDRAEQFIGRYADRPPAGLELAFSREERPLGTGGGLRHALPLLSRPAALVLNGDSYADADRRDLFAKHRRWGARATLLLARVPDASRFGRVEVAPTGAVLSFVEKGRAGPGLINAGVYAIERSVIEEIPADRDVSLERETFPSLVGRGLFAHAGEFPFVDIGTPESLAEAGPFFERKRP